MINVTEEIPQQKSEEVDLIVTLFIEIKMLYFKNVF